MCISRFLVLLVLLLVGCSTRHEAFGQLAGAASLNLPSPTAHSSWEQPAEEANTPCSACRTGIHQETASTITASSPFAAPRRHRELSETANSQQPGAYAAMCLIVKNQNTQLREWVYYHHWIGFRTIYVYDHNSKRPANLDLLDWIRAGVVEYTSFSGHHNLTAPRLFFRTAQGYAYQDCLHRSQGRHTWLAFVDADEFLVLSNPTERIDNFLKAYEPYGALVVNWRVFGSSGLIEKPTAPTMLAYTSCIPDSPSNGHGIHVKVIANVEHTAGIGLNPHVFKYKPGFFSVNEKFTRCEKHFCSPISADHIILHHYLLKSKQEFQQKIARGGGMGDVKSWWFFNEVEKVSTSTCLQGVEVFQRCCAHAFAPTA